MCLPHRIQSAMCCCSVSCKYSHSVRNVLLQRVLQIFTFSPQCAAAACLANIHIQSAMCCCSVSCKHSHSVHNVLLQRVLQTFTFSPQCTAAACLANIHIQSLKCRYCVTCEIYSRSCSIVVFTELTVSLASGHAAITKTNNCDMS